MLTRNIFRLALLIRIHLLQGFVHRCVSKFHLLLNDFLLGFNLDWKVISNHILLTLITGLS